MSRLQTLLDKLPRLQIPAHSVLYKLDHFPKLPLEIQIMVWKRAARHPRLIKIFEIETRTSPYGSDSVIEGHPVNPGIMGACKESRKEGLKVYRLFTSRIPDPYTNKPVTIYINFRADTFLLDAPNCPMAPLHVAQPVRPRTYHPADGYNWDIKYIERIERLLQIWPEDRAMRLPLNLLRVSRIDEYHPLMDFNVQDEKETLLDNVVEDQIRLDFAYKYEEFLVTRMREKGMNHRLNDLNFELWFRGDSYGSDLVPAPPAAED